MLLRGRKTWHPSPLARQDRRRSLTDRAVAARYGWHPLEGSPQRQAYRECRPRQLQQATNTIHLAHPIDDFAECRVHVNPVKMRRQVLPIGKSVSSRVTHHRRGTGGTALMSQRCGLFNEAEGWHWYTHSLRFPSTFRATLSSRCHRVQQGSIDEIPACRVDVGVGAFGIARRSRTRPALLQYNCRGTASENRPSNMHINWTAILRMSQHRMCAGYSATQDRSRIPEFANIHRYYTCIVLE